MSNLIHQMVTPDPVPPPSVDAQELRWYAVYTCARHEKKIAEQFAQMSIERFLPVYETVHRWKDRRMRILLPLFPSYIFVRISLSEQLRVLQTPSVVRFVSFNGKPTPLSEAEIDALQRGLKSGVHAEPHPYATAGRSVRVKAGPLCGLTGKLVRRKENYRIVISIDSIHRSIICEVSLEDVDFPSVGIPRYQTGTKGNIPKPLGYPSA